VRLRSDSRLGKINLLMRLFPFVVGDAMRGIVITLLDVTKLKEAERALEARNVDLRRVNASLEQFTHIVSPVTTHPCAAI
jgi:hypothetical protein